MHVGKSQQSTLKAISNNHYGLKWQASKILPMNIWVNRDNKACLFKRSYGKMLSYSDHLQAFGQIGIVKNGVKISSKLNNKGKDCMMLGYAKDNATGTY